MTGRSVLRTGSAFFFGTPTGLPAMIALRTLDALAAAGALPAAGTRGGLRCQVGEDDSPLSSAADA